ncbi:MAG: hypothetical protein U0807_16470 [Candidatus Binatia bacterium]
MTGYRVYSRALAAAYGQPADAGMPTPAADGSLSFQLAALDVRTDYGFVVTGYRPDGSESAYSNEMTLGYAQVAAQVDSDGDGLSDAAEDVNLNRIVDAGETNPLAADTDGDGIGDATDLCKATAAGSPVDARGCACAQLNCDDGNACTTDTCSTPVQCVHATIAGCVACTTAAQCNDSNPCTSDLCTAGVCQHPALTNGAPCTDANACNGTETCQSGTCTAGTPLSCDDGNACTTDACSATSGCSHTAIAGCVACTTATQCNDGNPCTSDTCAAGVCAHGTVQSGTSCDDGDVCNGADTCQAGVCARATPLDCDDGNPCTADTCAAATGCAHAPITGCSACTTAAQCDDGDPCTADVCTANRCSHGPAPDGTVCSDGLFCTTDDRCAAGVCHGGVATCDYLRNDCRTPSCDEARRMCVTTPSPNGGTCAADTNPCDGTHACLDGLCIEGPAPSCDDGNACTTDRCDANAGQCVHDGQAGCCASDADCADTDACTTNERCDAGHCTSDPVQCTAPGDCQQGTCDPQAGCSTAPLPDGTLCDDHDPCTTTSACTSGACGPAGAALRGATAAEEVDVGDLGVTRFTLRPTGKKLRLIAQGRYATGSGLEAPGDVTVAIYDSEDTPLYEATIPNSAFQHTRNRAVYVAGGEAPFNGVRKVDLRQDGNTVRVNVRANVPLSVAGPLSLSTGQGVRVASARSPGILTWLLRLKSQCVRDPGMKCTRSAGGARQCR